ncbi:MAG: hypothetical protein KC431_13575, partial [Myxococcales bacterium]|nr:hypothetical protein [Myxococcales bacterium]
YEPLDANAPERIYPRFDHPDVAAVSLHAGSVSWQPDQPCSVASDVVTGVRNKVAREVARLHKPLIIDTDAARGPCNRDDNRKLWQYMLGAVQGGAAAFNHRDGEPYAVAADLEAHARDSESLVDEQALDALLQAGNEIDGKLPAMLPIWRFHPHPVAMEFDYCSDVQGHGHLVSWDNGDVYYSYFSGDAWQGPTLVRPASQANRAGRFNLPKIAVAGGTVYIVFGYGPSAGNGLSFVHKPQGGNWQAPIHFGKRPQVVVEYFNVTAHKGKAVVASSEDANAAGGGYQQRLYTLDGARVSERALGSGSWTEPSMASAGGKLGIVYRFRKLGLYTVTDHVDFAVENDLGGAESAGDPAACFDPQGRLVCAHIPFSRYAQRDVWHPYSHYPVSLQYKRAGQPSLTLDRYQPFNYTSFKTSLAFDRFGSAIVVADKDGVV